MHSYHVYSSCHPRIYSCNPLTLTALRNVLILEPLTMLCCTIDSHQPVDEAGLTLVPPFIYSYISWLWISALHSRCMPTEQKFFACSSHRHYDIEPVDLFRRRWLWILPILVVLMISFWKIRYVLGLLNDSSDGVTANSNHQQLKSPWPMWCIRVFGPAAWQKRYRLVQRASNSLESPGNPDNTERTW